MSDIGVSTGFQIMFVVLLLLCFLIGFIPGFYLSLLFMLKKSKKNINFSPIISFFCGLIAGYLSYNTILNWDLLPTQNLYTDYFIASLPYIVGLEILFAVIHYFFFLKRHKKGKYYL